MPNVKCDRCGSGRAVSKYTILRDGAAVEVNLCKVDGAPFREAESVGTRVVAPPVRPPNARGLSEPALLLLKRPRPPGR